MNDDWIEEADADHVSEDENSSKIATSVFLCLNVLFTDVRWKRILA